MKADERSEGAHREKADERSEEARQKMDPGALGIAWDGGGDGRIVHLREDVIHVRSARAFAPGSRPQGSLGTGDVVRMKTHRCKREDLGDGLAFTVEGRTLDMSRALRERIVALLPVP